MTEEELKVKFDYIQGIFNRCINHAYQIITDSIAAKSEYLNREQADELEQQEYIRTTDELAQLYIRYSVLDDIQNFYSIPDFFWESGFYEALKPDEKRKYLLFSPLSFDYSRYEQDNSVYDEELPYFSVVVRAVVLERYSAYLRKKKEDRTQTETQPQQEQEEQKPTTNAEFPIKAVPPIAETENPFGSILNDKQIELIADCINEVKMFNASVTVDDLKAILSCKPNVILRSNNNSGIGTFLITVMENIARTKYDVAEIHLSCFNENINGLLLYTKLGYIPYEIEKYINNNQQSALIKLKKIWKC